MNAAMAGAGSSDSGEPTSLIQACGCEEAIKRLHEYLDAEMPEPDCLRVAAHLATCTDCHDAADAERHVRELLRRSCRERAPEELRMRVVAEVLVRRVRNVVGVDRPAGH